jgi:hypothetical protein
MRGKMNLVDGGILRRPHRTRTMVVPAALLLLAGGTAERAHPQQPAADRWSIQVREDRAVEIGLEGRILVYPHLAVHPANPDHLLGTVWVSGPAADHRERIEIDRCATIPSTDGGRSWKRHDFPYAACGDPWVAFAADGTALFTAMVRHADYPSSTDAVVVHRSTDGGATWNERPVDLGRGHDHQMVAADGSAPERASWVYLVSSRQARAENAAWRASIFVARSRNGGQSFDPPVELRPNNLMIKAETPVVLSDGTLVLSYVEPTTSPSPPSNFRYFPQRRAWVTRSTDAGYSFSTPMFVHDACGPMPEQRFHLSALVAGTASSPFGERLYFTCNLAGGGGVVSSYSTDRGERWSDPIPVHSAHVDPAVRRRVLGAAVNRDGVVGVLWSDFRNSGPHCYDAYFAASVDGGQSFLPEQRVSAESSCPDPAALGGTTLWKDGGAYWGVAADSDGRFRLLWSDARGGSFQLRTGTVEVGPVPAEGRGIRRRSRGR